MLKGFFNKATANEQPTKLTNGRAVYEFNNGLKCYQEELNVGQDEQLVSLLANVETSKLDMNATEVRELVRTLVSEQILYKLLKVILVSDAEIDEEQLKTLKTSELQRIITDFFILNPAVKSWLKIIAGVLISIPQTTNTTSSQVQ